MNAVINTFKKSFQKAKDFFPTALPRGMTEFETWTKSIILTYDLPNNDSVVFALSIMISQLPANVANKPKRFFANCARKSMSNQIAYAAAEQLKAKQKANYEAEQAAEAAKAQADVQPV